MQHIEKTRVITGETFRATGMFPRFVFPLKGALTHHRPKAGGGIPPVGRAARSPRGNAAPAGASSPFRRCVMDCAFGRTVIGANMAVHSAPPRPTARKNCSPTKRRERLQIFHPCGGTKDGRRETKDERRRFIQWRFTILKQRLSAGAQAALHAQPLLI